MSMFENIMKFHECDTLMEPDTVYYLQLQCSLLQMKHKLSRAAYFIMNSTNSSTVHRSSCFMKFKIRHGNRSNEIQSDEIQNPNQ